MTILHVCIINICESGAHERIQEDLQHDRSGLFEAELEK
jgi:hypothetical protein